jgi:hypothetical protein
MLDDGEHMSMNDRSITGLHSSVDDIPLVAKSDDKAMEAGNIVRKSRPVRVEGPPP